MYMFFWFFKQFYYCLRRIFKSGLLLLVLFFIAFLFIFIKPCFAVEIPQAVLQKAQEVGYNGNNVIVMNPNNGNCTIISTTTNLTNQNDINYASYYNWRLTYQMGSPVLQNYNHTALTFYPYNGTTQTFGNPSTNTYNYWFFDVSNNVILYPPVWAKMDILYYNYSGHNNGDVYFSVFTNPSITNPSSNIINWSFTNLSIDCGSTPVDANCFLSFDYDNNYINVDISSYKTIINNTIIYNIPKSVITNNIVIRNGSSITFYLTTRYNLQVLNYELGSYTLDLTSQQQSEINEDSNKQLLSDISNNQQQTTQAINNLNNTQQQTTEAIEDLNDTITNSSVDNSSIYLPSDNSNDITADGLNGIFTSIYNAFCTGQAQDIVFPIPFTNKNITLPANYVRQMLSNNGASWIITIIEAFWWYLISRFIIKDITSKITKIKSGNIEDIENSNIKGDML